MFPLTALLGRVLDSEAVCHECRHCGTTVDTEDSRCQVCDSVDVATYRFT